MTVFFISDTHFDHANTFNKFKIGDLSLRPFHAVDEMNEHMIEKWNSVVAPNDKVYHLGDVGFKGNKLVGHVSRLNGKKKLIKGNHDIYRIGYYNGYPNSFYEIASCKELTDYKLIATHIPIHVSQLDTRWKANIHGHLHGNVIDDVRYVNVSVEQINYTPISLDEIVQKLKHYNIL